MTHAEFTINCSDFAPEDWGYLLGLDIYQDRMGQLLNDAYVKVTAEELTSERALIKSASPEKTQDFVEYLKNLPNDEREAEVDDLVGETIDQIIR